MLPRLHREGFRGSILCTQATADLLGIMLRDAAGLYLRDLERTNVRNARRGKPLQEPVYDSADVEAVLALCSGLPYGETFAFPGGASLVFRDAGHILGSAIVEISLHEQGRERRLVFSGDLGKDDSVLMNEPYQPDRADLLLVESTYGDRDHRSEEDTVVQLRDVLRRTWRQGGSVMIPAFAVGRCQDVLFHLGCLFHRGELDPWEVFLDSPMAIEVTQVYDRWLHIMDCADVRQLSEAHRSSLEDFLPRLKLARDTEDSMAINRIRSGAIIIAGSGMCTGGRIRHHFKQRIWDDRNTVLFTGYQARGTLGRRLVDGAGTIRLFGEEYVVKAGVETLGGLSAHAGQAGLLRWISGFRNAPQVVLVHGEPQAQDALAQRLWQDHSLRSTIPFRGQTLAF
jgi:metallo-beta-lactamase family protein